MVLPVHHLDLDRCPHCGVDTPSMPQRLVFETTNAAKDRHRIWANYTCARCGGVVLLGIDKKNHDHEMYPDTAHSLIADELPETAKRYLAQAIDACARSPDGAVLLAASTVDAMLKAKQLVKGSLYDRIGEATGKHLITNEMAAWAHEVRLDANDQRHADVHVEHATSDDAQRCIDFALALGEYLFVLPARVKRGHDEVEKTRREAEAKALKTKAKASTS